MFTIALDRPLRSQIRKPLLAALLASAALPSAAIAADTTAPSVYFKAPTTGKVVSGVLSGTACEAFASDNAKVSKVEFRVDGVLVNTETTAPFNCSWDTRNQADGAHTLSARAVDPSGNARTASASVQVANIPGLTVSGQAISWNRIGTIDSYVLATSVPGQTTTYRTVTGLSVTPPAVDGQTVTYSLRTNVSGSKWSPGVKIAYAATMTAPALSVSGQSLNWGRIGTVDSYVLATGVSGQATTYRTVTGLSDTPPVVDGQTVTYTLRTNVAGSNWSPQVRIAYPATVTATATPAPAPTVVEGTSTTVSGASVNTSIKGDTGFVESAFSFNPGALFFGGFEAAPWTNTFKPSGWNRQSNVSVVSGTNGFQGNALSVKYPKGSYSTSSVGSGGTEFRSNFDSTGLGIGGQDVAHLRYMVKFQDGFQFAKGGKLPGLCGGTCMGNQAAPNGTDNWNGRLMWTAGGKVNFYMYHYGMTTSYGTYHPWSQGGTQRAFTPGKWHCIEMAYKMNTPGQKDGALMAWFDGEPAYSNTSFQYRTTTSLKVDKLWFNTFFGGNTSDWASPQDQSTSFDNVAIAKQRIGCDTAA